MHLYYIFVLQKWKHSESENKIMSIAPSIENAQLSN